jgi:hypothetical protein
MLHPRIHEPPYEIEELDREAPIGDDRTSSFPEGADQVHCGREDPVPKTVEAGEREHGLLSGQLEIGPPFASSQSQKEVLPVVVGRDAACCLGRRSEFGWRPESRCGCSHRTRASTQEISSVSADEIG